MAALIGGIGMFGTWAGCGGKHQRAAAKKERAFEVGDPGDGWVRTKSGGAEKSWYSAKLFASIYADANCAMRFEDGELASLTGHLAFGVAQGELIREDVITLDGRDALIRAWNGTLDGVMVAVGSVVTKNNDCLYDILFIAPPSNFDQGWEDFERLVSGFQVRR